MPATTKMTRYTSDHDTGVIAYHVGENSITVQFKDGSCYLYDIEKPGLGHVNKMKKLAKSGAGLSTYISQYVRENYKAKW